jgi:hypothetical protein
MSMKKTLLTTALVVLLSAGIAGAQADFSTYVALGDSLTAGFASNGLVQFYQEHSYPALLAEQAGTANFQMPLVSAPGLPNLLELQSLSPLTLAPIPGPPGLPINAEYPAPYNNLGVPGSAVFDTLFTVGDINNLLAGNQDNVMHDLILRFPAAPDGFRKPGAGPGRGPGHRPEPDLRQRVDRQQRRSRGGDLRHPHRGRDHDTG